MHIRFTNPLRHAVLAALLALALVPAGAVAKSVTASLRVQGPHKALDPGTSYGTGTVQATTDQRAACGGSGKPTTIAGPTAMGILVTAAKTDRALRPVGISDKFSFGLTVCGIGNYVGFESTSFWLYKVNHKSPQVGADKYPLKPGDQVLWYFEDTNTGANTGDELALTAPAHATAGKAFKVHVWDYDAKGKRKPAAGAKIGGFTTDAGGTATIKVSKARRLHLRATHGHDIPSATVTVVVR
jgi:Domain of unknown function (DUF4430)